MVWKAAARTPGVRAVGAVGGGLGLCADGIFICLKGLLF